MLITYFDEVKYQAGRQPFYWLGGIVVDGASIRELEAQVNDLAEEVFGVRTMTRETEFHASDMLSGNGHFKGWTLNTRIDVLKRLITIFGNADDMGKIYVRMDPALMVGTDVERMAFMFLVERVDSYLRGRDTPGLLIGDRESETISGQFSESLSGYRTSGTSYAYGKELTHLIDTVHFTHSHHSRMLQLADLHVWLRQLCSNGDQERWHRRQIIDHVDSIDGCLFANKYKKWPTLFSWTRTPPPSPA